MVLQISENDKLEEEETEPRRKKHTIEAINAMRTPRTEWKSKHTNSNKLPVHANGLHTVASCNVLVFVAVCLFFCLFFLCRIALCHIAHIIVTGNVYIKTVSITTDICLTEMELNSITFDASVCECF